MTQSIDLTRAAMIRQQAYADATANNIANVSTPGFKLTRAELEGGEFSPPSGSAAAGTPFQPALSGGVRFDRLFSQGAAHDTGISTDLAISGAGFFVVQKADGTNAYTRGGQFRVDSGGRLTDGAGRPVQPPISQLAPGATLRIATDGTATAVAPDGSTVQLGRIQLAVFPNTNGLLSESDGLFTATAASGGPTLLAPGQQGAGAVKQGALEDANTDLSEQLSNLMQAQRAYQLNTSVFRIEDELLQMTNQMQTGA